MLNRTGQWILVLAAVLVGVWVSASLGDDPEAVDAPWTTDQIDFPAAPGSGEPFLTRGPDGVVYASWVEEVVDPDGVPEPATSTSRASKHRFVFSRFDEASETWASPTTIATGDNWFVNWADVPSISVGSEGNMIAHWLARNGNGRYAYGVRVSISENGGVNWSEPFWLHDNNSAAEHGFVAFAPTDDGGFVAVWLDGRAFVTGKKVMSLRTRTVSASGVLGDEQLLDERTCDCCPNAITRTPSGAIVAAYRNRSEEEIRDIYTIRLSGSTWSEPRVVSDDGWKINACPVNGPAIKSVGDLVAITWFTVGGGAPAVNIAFSNDDGRTFEPGQRIDAGNPIGRVGMTVVGSDRVVVSWIEGGGSASKKSGLMMRTVFTNGSTSDPFLVSPASTSRATGYPRIISLSDGRMLFLWTNAGEHKIVSAIAMETAS